MNVQQMRDSLLEMAKTVEEIKGRTTDLAKSSPKVQADHFMASTLVVHADELLKDAALALESLCDEPQPQLLALIHKHVPQTAGQKDYPSRQYASFLLEHGVAPEAVTAYLEEMATTLLSTAATLVKMAKDKSPEAHV